MPQPEASQALCLGADWPRFGEQGAARSKKRTRRDPKGHRKIRILLWYTVFGIQYLVYGT